MIILKFFIVTGLLFMGLAFLKLNDSAVIFLSLAGGFACLNGTGGK